LVTPGEFGCSTIHGGLIDAQDDWIWGSLSGAAEEEVVNFDDLVIFW
jgi:hypothetical protein